MKNSSLIKYSVFSYSYSQYTGSTNIAKKLFLFVIGYRSLQCYITRFLFKRQNQIYKNYQGITKNKIKLHFHLKKKYKNKNNSFWSKVLCRTFLPNIIFPCENPKMFLIYIELLRKHYTL